MPTNPWIGTKRIAFVPTYRPHAAPPDQIPPDWPDAILQRLIFDPDAQGRDRSFRGWVRAASSGRADVEPVVLGMETIDQQVVDPNVWEGKLGPGLRAQGIDAAAIVMLGGQGAGTNWGFWSRFVMAEDTGIWAMEMLHGLTGCWDFYPFGNDVDPAANAIGTFDEMSQARLSHPTIYTKVQFGWAEASHIAVQSGPTGSYDLQFAGLPQPPAAGRHAAVRIGDAVPHLMVEARGFVDAFDKSFDPGTGQGIMNEGVIVYRVQTTDPTQHPRPGFLLPLFNTTVRPLKVGESVVTDGVTVTVAGSIIGGRTVTIDNSSQHWIDLTQAIGGPSAASWPSADVNDALATQDIVFRDAAGHLHEYWRDARGQGTTDLTANAGAPAAQGNPFSYIDPTTNMWLVLYRGTDNGVHSLYWTTGNVSHDALTGSVGAPGTAGDPAGWFTPDGYHHVCYRDAAGHLHELWWTGQSAVGQGDLTGPGGFVPAAGDPSPYFDPLRNTSIVVFRATDGHIRSLYWSGPAAPGQDDLSGYARMPAAAGDPCAWFTLADDTHRIVYRAGNGHVVELFWPNVAPVRGRDLTRLAGSPPAAGNVTGGYNAADNTSHAIYAAADGTLHELWYFLSTNTVQWSNLSAAFGAPAAADRPVYFSTATAPHQHVAYRGTDGHIHELLW